MTEQDPRDAASHRLAPLVARALDDVVGLAKTVLMPLKRAIDANPELGSRSRATCVSSVRT